jgi:hypothetical protein
VTDKPPPPRDPRHEHCQARLPDVQDEDQLVDQAFPSATEAVPLEPSSPILAVVPESIIEASPDELAAYLESVFDAFEEIDAVLTSIPEGSLEACTLRGESPTAIVPDDVIAHPEELLRAIDRVESETVKLELLVRHAKHDLKRLKRYRLSRQSPGAVISEMRKADELKTLRYLVEFLHSIHTAAESFEQIELPKPHIRDYLEHLYQMEDWERLGVLVRMLERTVRRHLSRSGS